MRTGEFAAGDMSKATQVQCFDLLPVHKVQPPVASFVFKEKLLKNLLGNIKTILMHQAAVKMF
jgi:hypothetical protein